MTGEQGTWKRGEEVRLDKLPTGALFLVTGFRYVKLCVVIGGEIKCINQLGEIVYIRKSQLVRELIIEGGI